MRFRTHTLLLAAAISSFCATGRAQNPSFPAQTVNSYSNYTDPITKQPNTLTWSEVVSNVGDRNVPYDTTGLRALSHPPQTGHPRILFTASDVPALKQRLTTTVSGQIMYSHLQAFSAGLRGNYTDSAAYAVPDRWQGNYRGTHGNVQFWYYHDASSPFNPNRTVLPVSAFQALVNGSTTYTYYDPAKGGAATTVPINLNASNFWNYFTYDALLDLVNNDSAGATSLAAAVTTAIGLAESNRVADNRAAWLPVGSDNGGQALAFLYDFLYNWLTPAQKATWQAELVRAVDASGNYIPEHDNYGTFNSPYQSRSNWATFTYWLMPLLAVENETDTNGNLVYNQAKYQGIYRGVRNFITYGIFPSGAFTEAEAKDQLGGDALMAMAMRPGKNLFGMQSLQRYARNFLPASALANIDYSVRGRVSGKCVGQNGLQDGCTGVFARYDLLGQFGQILLADAAVLKYVFPDDSVIDWDWRAEVGENYQRLPIGNSAGGNSYWDDLLLTTIFTTDFNPANSDPSQLGLNLGSLFGERALMTARSDWTPNALQLFMHTRGVNGGHPYADRNGIVLAGAGRAWSGMNHQFGDNTSQSVVVIDQKPQAVESPGRVVDFQNTPLATFAVGDASYAWDWDVETYRYGDGFTPGEISNGSARSYLLADTQKSSFNQQPFSSFTFLGQSANDFGYTKMPEPYTSAPLYHLNSWIRPDGVITPMIKAPNYPVLSAFRTAGLVRGTSSAESYGLIVDDIQHNTASSHYDWQLLLESDLGFTKTALQPVNGVFDIKLAQCPANFVYGNSPGVDSNCLATGTSPGGPTMILRFIDVTLPATPAAPFVSSQTKPGSGSAIDGPVLVVPTDAIAPNFKVLAFALPVGAAPPVTTWDVSHTILTVAYGDFVDTITFTNPTSGADKTNFVITRLQNGVSSNVVTMNAAVPPLPPPAPDSKF